MIRAPSLFKPYDEFYSGDPAITPPPANATPDELAAYVKRIQVARETGNWDPILVPGAVPTKFRLRPITAEALAALQDYENGPDGTKLTNLIVIVGVRAALVAITGFPHPETGDEWVIRQEVDARFPKLGRIAAPEITDALWRITDEAGELIGPTILGELFSGVRERAMGLRPKS